MLILFDHGTPRALAAALHEHVVIEAGERGWDRLSNGELLKQAEAAGFELLLTTDQRIRYQQNLVGRKIALVVLIGSTRWSRVQLRFANIVSAVNSSTLGSYTEVSIPFWIGGYP